MDPHDPTRRRLLIGLGGLLGLGAVGSVAWLLADGEENAAAGGHDNVNDPPANDGNAGPDDHRRAGNHDHNAGR